MSASQVHLESCCNVVLALIEMCKSGMQKKKQLASLNISVRCGPLGRSRNNILNLKVIVVSVPMGSRINYAGFGI